MPRRAAFVLAVLAAFWLRSFVVRAADALYLLPRTMGWARVACLLVPGLVIAGAALYLARRWDLFSRAELGLEPTDWQRRHGIVGFRCALLIAGLFIGFALAYMLPPIHYGLSNELSHAEFLAEIRQHEYRSTLRQYEPISLGDLALSFVDGSVAWPFMEEAVFRALLVPLLLSWLHWWGAVLASGVVFCLTHWLVYQQGLQPQHFVTGVVFACVFLLVGLTGSVAAHAGGNAGVWLLALYAACAVP